MPSVWRFLRPAVLIVLVIVLAVPLTFSSTYAQGDQPAEIVIQGSLQLETLVSAIRDAYVAQNEDAQILIDAQGPNQGFQALCAGEADLVMSAEPITDQQITACANQGTDFVETVLAYDAVVLLADPVAGLTCLDPGLVEDVFSLGAEPDVTWDALGSTTSTDAVMFYGPDPSSMSYTLFASLLPAGDLREGIDTTQDAAGIIEAVSAEGSDAMGFLSLADWQAAESDAGLTPLAVMDDVGNCISPSLETVGNNTYPLARSAYLYVNADSAQREDVQAFVAFALTDEAGAPAVAADQGYSVPPTEAYDQGLSNVLEARTGRTFTRPATPVNVLTTQEGTVRIAGSSLLYGLTNQLTSGFSTLFVNAQLDQQPLGNDAGWEAFCAGEADVLAATAPASDNAFNACKENGVESYAIDLGLEALVLAVPSGNDWAQCITSEQVATLLSAGYPAAEQAAPAATEEAAPAADATEAAPAATEEPAGDPTGEPAPEPAPVTLWSEVNSDWPETPFLLVLPPLSTGETDYLIQTLTHALSFVPRSGTVENANALYRAQGVANTAQDEENPNSGITYLWWSDLQGSEADVRLLEVDAGSGCVAPSPETFADGSYALSFPVSYYVNRASFENPLVRALLWHFFDQDTIETLRESPFALSDYDTMATAQRDEVFALLEDYEASQAEQEAEATPAATEEAAPAGTEEPAATEAAPAMTEAAPMTTEEAAPEVTATEEPAAPAATEAAGS